MYITQLMQGKEKEGGDQRLETITYKFGPCKKKLEVFSFLRHCTDNNSLYALIKRKIKLIIKVYVSIAKLSYKYKLNSSGYLKERERERETASPPQKKHFGSQKIFVCPLP